MIPPSDGRRCHVPGQRDANREPESYRQRRPVRCRDLAGRGGEHGTGSPHRHSACNTAVACRARASPSVGVRAMANRDSVQAAGLAWTLVMNHCQTLSSCHEHPIQTVTGVRSGSFVAPDQADPSYLTLRLTVRDSGGLRGHGHPADQSADRHAAPRIVTCWPRAWIRERCRCRARSTDGHRRIGRVNQRTLAADGGRQALRLEPLVERWRPDANRRGAPRPDHLHRDLHRYIRLAASHLVDQSRRLDQNCRVGIARVRPVRRAGLRGGCLGHV